MQQKQRRRETYVTETDRKENMKTKTERVIFHIDTLHIHTAVSTLDCCQGKHVFSPSWTMILYHSEQVEDTKFLPLTPIFKTG